MSIFTTISIKALKDNYIWCIINKNLQQCIVVDPGDAMPVIKAMEILELELQAILITHHHSDHTNGIAELLKHYDIPIYGAHNSPNPYISVPMTDQQQIIVLDELEFTVLTIPGHTLDHIAYYGNQQVFCGDTLFAAGCGRIFEGTAEQMYMSLSKLAQLPEDTHIYCGHEYTWANLKFAKLVEPHNLAIDERIHATQAMLADHIPTLPSTLAIEKNTNPFLRSNQTAVIDSLQQHYKKTFKNPIEIFYATRQWKDNFTG